MVGTSVEFRPDSSAEWLLTPEELTALRSSRRLFVLGLAATVCLALGAAATTAWVAGTTPGWSVLLMAVALAGASLTAVGAWCFVRARIVGQDIRVGRAEMQWGRVARVWRGLRVAEVEGTLFPLQLTSIPVLRPGERVHLRYAPRSRITFAIHTLREVVAAEQLAGRSVCSAALAELEGMPSPAASDEPALQTETPGNRGGRGSD